MNCSSSSGRPLAFADTLDASKCCQCQRESTCSSSFDAYPFLFQVPTYSTALAVAHSHQSPHPTGGDYCIFFPTLFDATIAFIQAHLKPNLPPPRRQDQLLRRQPTAQTSSNHSNHFFWFNLAIDALNMLFVPALKSL